MGFNGGYFARCGGRIWFSSWLALSRLCLYTHGFVQVSGLLERVPCSLTWLFAVFGGENPASALSPWDSSMWRLSRC